MSMIVVTQLIWREDFTTCKAQILQVQYHPDDYRQTTETTKQSVLTKFNLTQFACMT